MKREREREKVLRQLCWGVSSSSLCLVVSNYYCWSSSNNHKLFFPLNRPKFANFLPVSEEWLRVTRCKWLFKLETRWIIGPNYCVPFSSSASARFQSAPEFEWHKMSNLRLAKHNGFDHHRHDISCLNHHIWWPITTLRCVSPPLVSSASDRIIEPWPIDRIRPK